MSEYQYIAFRAIDRPLTEKELEFARTQSSRADITRWSFENEYHYGNFRGDANALLRKGFDVYLHYANYGIRNASFRMPHGLLLPKVLWSAYIGIQGLTWTKDARGDGGTLSISPYYDGGDLDEIDEPSAYMDDLVQLRQHLIQGDLGALYLLWLCAAGGDEAEPDEVEPPVPIGLDLLYESCGDMLSFFGLDPLMLVAASEANPSKPDSMKLDPTKVVVDWLEKLSEADTRESLRRLMTEDAVGVKAELMAVCRNQTPVETSSTVFGTRTISSLRERTEQLREKETWKAEKLMAAKAKRATKKNEQQRQKRMQEMIKEPNKWLLESEKLADARGIDNYKMAAEMLSDLREAVGGERGEKIAKAHAAHLAKKHPTLTQLKSSLRKRGLLD